MFNDPQERFTAFTITILNRLKLDQRLKSIHLISKEVIPSLQKAKLPIN